MCKKKRIIKELMTFYCRFLIRTKISLHHNSKKSIKATPKEKFTIINMVEVRD